MSELARRYAHALPDDASLEAALWADRRFLQENLPLWNALTHPGIPDREKHALLKRVCSSALCAACLPFYDVLCTHGRLGLLDDILQEYHLWRLSLRGAAQAVLTCAFAPDAAQQEEILVLLRRLHGKQEIELHVREDASLMGGFFLQIEGTTYDCSLRRVLEGLMCTLCVR